MTGEKTSCDSQRRIRQEIHINACTNIKLDCFLPQCQLSPNAEGSAELCEAIGASLRTQVKTFKSCNLCPDSSLSGNSIYSITIIKLPFYDRSRMTGRYLIPFCKKLFYLSAHSCPFRRLVPPPQPRQSVSHTFTASLRSSKSGSLASRHPGTAYGLHSFSLT